MANNLLSVWGTIGSVALAILILLVMITIHEFGHYLAGKLFHFKIDEFSIGFGPALFKHKRKKTGELFAIRLIPLGGYCAFAGEDGLEEEPEETEEPFAEIAGQADGEEKDAPEQAPSAEESELPERDGGAENKAPEKSASGEKASETERAGWFTNRPCWQRIIVLAAGAFMNYLLALFLILIGFLAYGQTMIAVYEAEPSETVPAEYSLSDLDILLGTEESNFYLTSDIAHALNGKKKGDLAVFRVSRVVGKEGDRNLREEREVKVMLREDVEVKNSADFTSVWRALGVKYYPEGSEGGEGFALANAVYRFDHPGEAIGRSFVYSFKIAGSIFKILGELLTGKLGLSAFGGPVTTITMTSQIVSRGFRYFLEIAGYIGVNLAVFNLLPIPALDGSKIVFTAIEWVRGKPISRKVEAIIHAVGFVLLLGFAVLVDILQFVL